MKHFTLTLTNLEGDQLVVLGFVSPDEAEAVSYVFSLVAPTIRASGLVPNVSEDGKELQFRPAFTGEVLES